MITSRKKNELNIKHELYLEKQNLTSVFKLKDMIHLLVTIFSLVSYH